MRCVTGCVPPVSCGPCIASDAAAPRDTTRDAFSVKQAQLMQRTADPFSRERIGFLKKKKLQMSSETENKRINVTCVFLLSLCH